MLKCRTNCPPHLWMVPYYVADFFGQFLPSATGFGDGILDFSDIFSQKSISIKLYRSILAWNPLSLKTIYCTNPWQMCIRSECTVDKITKWRGTKISAYDKCLWCRWKPSYDVCTSVYSLDHQCCPGSKYMFGILQKSTQKTELILHTGTARDWSLKFVTDKWLFYDLF